MGGWYWVGVCLGLGVALGTLASAALAGSRAGLVGAALLAAVAGAAIGLGLGDLPEALGGMFGGLAGAAGSSELTQGSLRRGAARIATVLFVGLGALVLAALAFVPALGYVEAVALPALGMRLRRRNAGRYAGLRILDRY